MLEQVFGNHYRWTCDVCGYHRSDYGPELTALIQARHICEEAGMPAGKTIILLCWEQLDGVMDEYMPLYAAMRGGTIALGDEARLEHLKAKARGMAEIMSIWTVPHFRTADDIAREATARYRARVAGEERVTLGTVVATAAADLAITFGREGYKANPPKSKPARPSHNFSEATVAQIKNGLASGMFTKSDLATMFKTSEAVIESIVTPG